jgi:hypothetical protein
MTAADTGLFAPGGATTESSAAGIAWLWRLGEVLSEPSPAAVGIGSSAEEQRLRELVAADGLAGAVVFAQGSEARRREVSGVARFPTGERVRGTFTVFDSGEPTVRSSLGAHAVREGSVLLVGADPEAWWGRLEYHWVLAALEPFLAERMGRPMVKLPPVGVVRLDDIPGTAQHQMQGTARSDSRQTRRVSALRAAFGNAGARLNTAVAAEALDGQRRVPLDEVWPRAIAELRAGTDEGAFEAVCHGLLHLVPEKMEQGEVDWLEFRSLSRGEAGRRIAAACAWHERALGRRPATFLAPAWGYSDGSLQAAADYGVPAWLPPAPGPLLDGENLRETLDPGLRGMFKLDYSPLARWAAGGMPPTLVFHGGMFDLRTNLLPAARDYLTLARLALKRDIMRVPETAGVKWIGASEYAELLRGHDEIPGSSPGLRSYDAAAASYR